MHQPDGRFDARIRQVPVVTADLVGHQQTLVDHGAGGHRRHEVLAPVLQLQGLDLVAGGLADHVQLPLQRIGHHDVFAAADKDLADHRLTLAHARRHRHLAVHRHVAPAQNDLALGAHAAFQLLFAGQARGVLARQEHHPDAVFARGRKLHALFKQFLAVVGIRYLDQDPGAVAEQGVGADRAPVVQVAQDQQRVFDQFVAAIALDMDDEADAARVVFVRAGVKPMLLRGLDRRIVGSRLHRPLQSGRLRPESLSESNVMQRIIGSNSVLGDGP